MEEQAKPPKCPGCSTAPLRFSHNAQVLSNGAIIGMLWCTDCGHVLSMSQVGQKPPAIAPPDLRIIKPS